MAMDRAKFKSVLLTLSIGLAGAGLASYARLPAAPLIGASISVSLAALIRLPVGVPLPLRNIAFAIIGCSLGSGITKQALAQSVQWPISLIILGLSVAAIMLICSWFISHFYPISAETAVLSTAPGTIAYVLAIAAGGVGDVRTIMVIQNIRLVLVTTLLPFILDHIGIHPTAVQAAADSSYAGSLVIILITLGIGFSIRKWQIPASYLLVGMICSGIAHYLDLVSGRPPFPLIFFGFTVTGSVVGSRFSSISRQDLRRLLGVALGSLLIAGLLAALFAYPSAVILDIPFGQSFVAYAPGGVEAMAAMAIALGYDPAFVAVHHLFRIFLLFLFVPLSIKLVRKIPHRADQSRRNNDN